jgi:hypothetical protein
MFKRATQSPLWRTDYTNGDLVGGDRDRIHPVGVLVQIAFIFAVAILFNFFPERVGVLVSADQPDSFVPLLTPEFARLLPWLNLYWGLAFTLCLVHLSLGRWYWTTRLADLLLSTFGLFVLLLLLTGGPIVSLTPGQAVAGEPLAQLDQGLMPLASALLQGVLWLAFLAGCVVVAKKLLCLFVGTGIICQEGVRKRG